MEFSHALTVVALVVTGFIATSLDNLLILVLLLGAARRKLAVVVGFLCSSLAVMVLSSLGYLLGGLVDASLVGWLGVIPLGMGLRGLWQPADLDHPDAKAGLLGGGAGFAGSFGLMLGNSGDSLALFLPLLADIGSEYFRLLFMTWILTVVGWSGLALLIGSNPSLAALIERRGAKLVPWAMIIIGGYILLDTGTDKLLG